MATVTKRDVVERIAVQTGMSRTDVRRILDTMLNLVVQELAEGNRLEFRDYGVFDVKVRGAREAQNPKTGVRVSVPERRSVRFKPGKLLRQAMEGPSPEVTIRLTGARLDARSNHRLSTGG